MFGVIVNALAICVGGTIGLLLRNVVSDSFAKRIELVLGYCSLVIGLRMAIRFENVLVLLGCIGVGGMIGWQFNLEQNIEKGAKRLQLFLTRGRESKFATGFTISSILFCVGGMAVIGPIQSGVLGNNEVLFTKALLDGTISIPLAGVYGSGVIFSSIPILLYQGGIALLASKAQFLNQPHLINEMSGVGGVLVLMIGVNLSKLSKVPVGDFLPAMILVILWALTQ